MTFAELKPGTFIRSIMSSRQGGWPDRCADDTMATQVQSQSNLVFVGEDGEADEYLSGKDWATEASQAPMGLAAIYCHPLEFFLSDLMYFPQTITVPSTTATNFSPSAENPMKLWRTEDCWTGWMSSQALECKGPHNPIQPMGEAALAHARTVFPISKAFGCWPGWSPNKWRHWCWSLSWTGRKVILSTGHCGTCSCANKSLEIHTVSIYKKVIDVHLWGGVDGLCSDGYADPPLWNSVAMDWPFLISGRADWAHWETGPTVICL